MRSRYPSNTETPKYYREFRAKVEAGIIPVSATIAMEMNRIDYLISSPVYYYDPRPVESWIKFCEEELTKTDGSKVKMLSSFKLWGEQLFGWYYWSTKPHYTKNGVFEEIPYLKRLISKQYIVLARGGGKSIYESFIQSYFLSVDGESKHQITTAPTMRQAEEVLTPIRVAMIRKPGPLLTFLSSTIDGIARNKIGTTKQFLVSTRKGIENHLTASKLEIRPMSIDKLQGLRPKISTVDEWLSGDVREDVVGALEQGASKLNDYIIVAVSSEGTVRNGSGDDIKMELLSILRGEYENPYVSIFYYRLDDVEEVGIPELWQKAQPNIGLTVSYETYHRDVERAENTPSVRNDILAKRFGLPMEGFTYFFTYEETIPQKRIQSYKGMECSLGADMSQGDDFCSFTFLFPMDGFRFGIKSLSFITDRTLKGLSSSMRVKYETFLSESSLIVLDGTILNMDEVFFRIEEFVEKMEYDVRCFGYDPYNADLFVKMWTQSFGPFGIEVVRQGVRTESVPLGEIKKLAEDRGLLFDQDIFGFAMGNSMVMVDTNGNQKLYKRRYEAKIDPVSALLDAYVAFTRNVELFR